MELWGKSNRVLEIRFGLERGWCFLCERYGIMEEE